MTYLEAITKLADADPEPRIQELINPLLERIEELETALQKIVDNETICSACGVSENIYKISYKALQQQGE